MTSKVGTVSVAHIQGLEKNLRHYQKSAINDAKNVDHRFFVHDAEAYEVQAEQFYQVGNSGGTHAAPVYQLIHRIATNEYDPSSTNF